MLGWLFGSKLVSLFCGRFFRSVPCILPGDVLVQPVHSVCVLVGISGHLLLSSLTPCVSRSAAGRSCSRTCQYWLCGRGAADSDQHQHYQSDRPQLHREGLRSPWTDLSREPDADTAPGSSEESATGTVTPGSAPYECYE